MGPTVQSVCWFKLILIVPFESSKFLGFKSVYTVVRLIHGDSSICELDLNVLV
jgi:hypothetical protein